MVRAATLSPPESKFHAMKLILLVHESVSDHYIRYWCVSVCLSVCPEHSSMGFDPILIKFWLEVYIMI